LLRGYGSTALVGASPTPSATEAIRLDQEPVPKTGRGREALGRSSRPASALAANETKRSRARRAGRRSGVDHAAMVERSRHRALNPEAGVRFPVAVLKHTPMPGGRAARRPAVTRKAGVRAPPWQHIARWPRSSGAWLQTTRRGCDSRPGVHRNIATRGRRPTARMPVRHIGDEGSSPSDHTQQRPTQH
jgi:hypothetical protein